MKKKLIYLVCLLAITPIALCSCSDDDGPDGGTDLMKGTLADAPYNDDAVIYTISGNDEIGSIELTASGNCVILPPETEDYSMRSISNEKKSGLSMFKKQKKETESRYIETYLAWFGNYEKNSDGSITLVGYGTLYVIDDDTLELERIDGTTYTLDVDNVESAAATGSLDRRICRTWYVINAAFTVYDANGKVVYSETIEDQEEIEEEYVKSLTVCGKGTFFRTDWDNTLDGYGQWWWQDEEIQLMGYQWLDEDYPDDGEMSLRFVDSYAWFSQEYLDEDGYRVIETVMTQAR